MAVGTEAVMAAGIMVVAIMAAAISAVMASGTRMAAAGIMAERGLQPELRHGGPNFGQIRNAARPSREFPQCAQRCTPARSAMAA